MGICLGLGLCSLLSNNSFLSFSLVVGLLLLALSVSFPLANLLLTSQCPLHYGIIIHLYMKIAHEINTNSPLCELSRLSHTISGYDRLQNIIQIDTKHNTIIKQKLIYPPLNLKCLSYENTHRYFMITLNQIQCSDGEIISQSNSKAEFTGAIDCHIAKLLFSKYHHDHNKHSVNLLVEGSKKIIRLLDQPVTQNCFNRFNNQIIYSSGSTVYSFDPSRPEEETVLKKKVQMLYDFYNLYLISNNIGNKAKEQFECGIYESRTGKCSDVWNSKELPIQIEMFARSLIVASSNLIQFYDTRKLFKPYEREAVRDIESFLYEPNIGKVYLGCQNGLKIYSL